MRMSRHKVTAGGQIQLPAPVRNRWKTSTVEVIDGGDHVVVRPAPENPFLALLGALAAEGIDSSALRERARLDERAAEERRQPPAR